MVFEHSSFCFDSHQFMFFLEEFADRTLIKRSQHIRLNAPFFEREDLIEEVTDALDYLRELKQSGLDLKTITLNVSKYQRPFERMLLLKRSSEPIHTEDTTYA